MADYTKTSAFSADNNFTRLRYPSSQPLLEVDMNEMQAITAKYLLDIVKNISGTSGVISRGSLASTIPTYSGRVLTIPTGFTLQIGGNLLAITNPDTADGSHVITMPSVTASYLVFAEAFSIELDYSSSVHKYGSISSTTLMTNKIKDSRLSVDTSRRLQLAWRLRTAVYDPALYPQGLTQQSIYGQGTASSPLSAYPFTAVSTDGVAFVAGLNGDATAMSALGSVDGCTYGVALYRVDVNATTGITSVIDLRTKLLSISQLTSTLSGLYVPQIIVVTGTVDCGATIPLPAGYTEAQCRWILSVDNRQVDDDDTISLYTSSAVNDRSLPGRVATNWTGQRGGRTSNYILIGVK